MRENGAVKRTGLVAALVLAVVACAVFASRLWTAVLHFDPGFTFAHRAVPTGPPLSSGVTILLVDGLRLDASRRMPVLNALRVRGASIEATVGTPSFSRPGRATIVVGAPPAIHGVTTNRQKRAIPLDSLIRRVGDAGGTCRIAGSKIWSSLFGEDIARCGVYREGEGKEGPGMFVRQIPEIRDAEEKGITFVLEQPATLRIADIISTDFAAHEYGGASPEYAAELARADTIIERLAGRFDLSRETLVITADHGHRDAGGHGGDEPEVLAIPIVMVGAGIRSSVNLTAHQADIAPTLAALLGVGLPTASSGHPLESVLLADDGKLAQVKGAMAMQKEAFEKGVAARLGLQSSSPPGATWTDLMAAHADKARGARTLIMVLLVVLIVGATIAAIRLARPDRWSLAAGVALGLLALLGPIRPAIPLMSFSGINYDEMLIPFFVKVMTLAAVTALVALAASLVAGRVHSKRLPTDSPITDAAAVALLLVAPLGVGLIGSWWSHVLLSPVLLPGPGAMVVAYALTLSIISVAATSLAVLAVLAAVEHARPAKK